VSLECSIVIPLFNRADLTAQCLRSLVANTRSIDYEVVIVDNGSTDETPEVCAAIDGNVTVIRNDDNRGFAAACNQGAAAADSDVLVFLNNDTQPLAGWLPPLLDGMDTDPDVGMIGCKLLFPDGLIQHGGVAVLERVERPRLNAMHLPYQVPADDRLASTRREVAVVTAAAVAVRRRAFEAVGGFDEGYWNGYEDVDLCFALGSSGWKVMYEPASVLVHHESASGAERFSRTDANIERLESKWAGRVVPDLRVDAAGTMTVEPEGRYAAFLASERVA